jgi:hypothetical protein
MLQSKHYRKIKREPENRSKQRDKTTMRRETSTETLLPVTK